MESKVANLLGCRFKPIVIVKTDKKPEDAIGPKVNGAHCIMSYIARVITDRKTALFEKSTLSCAGAVSGLGFGNGYSANGNDIENYSAFLSTGLKDAKDKEKYQAFCNTKPEASRPMFEGGERIYSNYDRAYKFLTKTAPIFENKEKYIVFKPLEDLEEDEIPSSVIFTLDTIELSVLIDFDSSLRDDINYTMTPPSAACQAMASYVFAESEKDNPHAVLGLLDLAGRRNMRKWVPDNYLNYSLPWKLFLKLENNCNYSYLDGHVWKMMKGDL